MVVRKGESQVMVSDALAFVAVALLEIVRLFGVTPITIVPEGMPVPVIDMPASTPVVTTLDIALLPLVMLPSCSVGKRER